DHCRPYGARDRRQPVPDRRDGVGSSARRSGECRQGIDVGRDRALRGNGDWRALGDRDVQQRRFWTAGADHRSNAAARLPDCLPPSPAIALLGAALTGFGYSLAFPALCLEAVRRVPPQSRGSAIGAYVVCLDFSLASAGPVAGLLVAPLGYSAIYLLGGGCAALAAMLTIGLLPQATPATAPGAAE